MQFFIFFRIIYPGSTEQRLNVYKVVPLNEDQAWDIMSWRYPVPYDFYDPPIDEFAALYVQTFIKPELLFHAVLDPDSEMIGFCSFGIDGQVPGGDYSQPSLDIGLGMKPQFTGRGLGFSFFNAILYYAQKSLGASQFRLTVANFNQRALCLYRKFGFQATSEFRDSRTLIDYTILMGNHEHVAVLQKI